MNNKEESTNKNLIPTNTLVQAIVSQNPKEYSVSKSKTVVENTNPPSENTYGSSPELVTNSEGEEEFPEDFPDYTEYNPNALPDLLGTEQVQILKKREDTRGTLAIVYTVATFSMFVLGFIAAILDAAVRGTSVVEGLTNILPLISGIFLGSLGFVLGYYFRKSEE